MLTWLKILAIVFFAQYQKFSKYLIGSFTGWYFFISCNMGADLVTDRWWTVWFDILFTISQLPNLNPCWRIYAAKCVQRTIALYQYKLFNLFPFCVIEFCEVVIFKPWTQYVWSKSGILFFSHAQPPLGLWLDTLQCEWINILLRTPSIWFLLDLNALRFSLHLAKSVVREIQKTKRSVIVPVLSSCCSESQI